MDDVGAPVAQRAHQFAEGADQIPAAALGQGIYRNVAQFGVKRPAGIEQGYRHLLPLFRLGAGQGHQLPLGPAQVQRADDEEDACAHGRVNYRKRPMNDKENETKG